MRNAQYAGVLLSLRLFRQYLVHFGDGRRSRGHARDVSDRSNDYGCANRNSIEAARVLRQRSHRRFGRTGCGGDQIRCGRTTAPNIFVRTIHDRLRGRVRVDRRHDSFLQSDPTTQYFNDRRDTVRGAAGARDDSRIRLPRVRAVDDRCYLRVFRGRRQDDHASARVQMLLEILAPRKRTRALEHQIDSPGAPG